MRIVLPQSQCVFRNDGPHSWELDCRRANRTQMRSTEGPTDKSAGPIAAITGANGYVGSVVERGLAAAGFQIRRLVRQPEPSSDDHRFDLHTGCSPAALRDVDTLVHCAYDLSVTSPGAIWQTNVFGSRALLAQAEAGGVRRTILVSSMSAYAGTRQIYGRAKLASETDAFARGMCAVRPGLVYGPTWGGMAGTLRRLTSLPIVPLIGPGARQFTIHEDDLRDAIVALALARTAPSMPLGLANPEPVPFGSLLQAIAKSNGKDRIRFFPVPWQPLYWTLRGIEKTSVTLPVRADSILGLVKPAPSVPAARQVADLGISFRQMAI